MVEHITNSLDVSDRNNNTKFSSVLTRNNQDALAISYFTDMPESDELNKENREDPGARLLYYGITERGVSIISGNEKVSTRDLDSSYILKDAMQSLLFDLSINFSQTGSQTFIEAMIAYKEDSMINRELVVQFALVERVVSGLTLSNGEKNAEWVLRDMLPSSEGIQLEKTTWEKDDKETIAVPWNGFSDNIRDKKDALVIAFIQNNRNREIYQVDSSLALPRIISALEEERKEFSSIKLYPNPIYRILNIEFNQNTKEITIWKIFNQIGQYQRDGIIPSGIKDTQLFLWDLPEGLYFIRFEQRRKISPHFKVIIKH